jgi:hypothetical protein
LLNLWQSERPRKRRHSNPSPSTRSTN